MYLINGDIVVLGKRHLFPAYEVVSLNNDPEFKLEHLILHNSVIN